MFKKTLSIIIFVLGLTVGFSASAASGTCPTDNGAGVGCNIGIGEYYCLSACRTGQSQCPSWSGTVCASGLVCPANCNGADTCGYCNSCASGYTLCGSYPSQTCTANTTAPAHCTSYNQCTATCSACANGYVLLAGACVGATLKLGPDSVGAGNYLFQSVVPSMYILSNGVVGIGTSTPNASLEISPISGYSILAGNFKVGNVALPTADADAATKGYVDSTISSATSSMTGLPVGISGQTLRHNGTTWVASSVLTNDTSSLFLNSNGGIPLEFSTFKSTNSDGNNIWIGGGGKVSAASIGNTSQASYNSAFGYYALQNLTTGYSNVAIGHYNLKDNTSGFFNTVIGNRAMQSNTTGYYNTALGADAANSATNNTYGLFLGYNARPAGLSDTNEIVIGSNALGLGSNTVVIGDTNITKTILRGNIGIGTTTPLARLAVVPASGYSILAGNYRIGNVALPIVNEDAATKGYVDSVVSLATSSMTGLPVGISGQTLRHNGTDWVANSLLFNNGTNIGIGSTLPASRLDITNSAASLPIITLRDVVGNVSLEIRAGTSTLLNTFIGLNAGRVNTTGHDNTANGAQALYSNIAGQYNTANGSQALYFNVSNYNTADGYQSLYSNTYGYNNIAIGFRALYSNTFGYYNSASGYESLYSNINGNNNNASGIQSLRFNTASNNTAFGHQTLYSNTTGANNTAFGYRAGYGDGTTVNMRSVIDTNSMFLGYQASRDASVSPSTALNNATAIGYNAKVARSNSLILGGTGTDAVNVGIGTTTPFASLEVVPASGYSILAGNYRIGNVALPTVDADAATKGYVDAAISLATSSVSSIASFVGVTAATYSGNNGSNSGYAYAHAQCSAAYTGSHVCATFEILSTIQAGGSVPSQDAWIFAGPPGYTVLANDCDARTSGAAAAYGAYWQKPGTGYLEGRGLLIQCNNVMRLACCL